MRDERAPMIGNTPIPEVSIEFRSIKHTLRHFFNQYSKDFEKVAESAVNEAMDSVMPTLMEESKKMAREIMRNKITRIVENALTDVIWDDGAKSEMTKMVIRKLKEKQSE